MTIKELKQILDKYPEDTVLVRKYPYHWYSESEELTEDNFHPEFVKGITNNRGKKIKGNFLILYCESGYNY